MKKTTVYRRPMDENLFEEELTIEFLGIHTVDEIPDEKTVWHVKNILSKVGTFDALFDKFRSIGIVHAKAATALTCLVYNIFRYVQINKYQPQLIAAMG